MFRHGSSPLKERASGSAGSRGGHGDSADSFQDYWESVNDAWDCADDEFANLAGRWYTNLFYVLELLTFMVAIHPA